MALPPFIPSIDDTRRDEIAELLHSIAGEKNVRILFAIESGSRAWGFPSPDSDYDVRFVYAHPTEWYISLSPGRDVIERPISDDLDVGGWDIRKALNLLLKPNPVMLEWLTSPIRYQWDEPVCTRLLNLAERTTFAGACLYHYLHLGEGQWRRAIEGRPKVNYKKYFYVLRPALAIRWIRLNPDMLPPMNIQAMSNALELNPDQLRCISELLEVKSKARETGEGEPIAVLDDLIKAEFEWARTNPVRAKKPNLRDEANALFRTILAGGV